MTVEAVNWKILIQAVSPALRRFMTKADVSAHCIVWAVVPGATVEELLERIAARALLVSDRKDAPDAFARL